MVTESITLPPILAKKGYGDVIHNTGTGRTWRNASRRNPGGYRGTSSSRRESTNSFASPKLQP